MLFVIFRGFLAFIVLTATVVLSAHFVLDDPSDATVQGGADGEKPHSGLSLSMAPISLGNPALARANLQFDQPDEPYDAPIGFQAYSQNLRTGKGDTLSNMLLSAGVESTEAEAAIKALSGKFNPRRIKPGQDITVTFLPDTGNTDPGKFLGLVVDDGFAREIKVVRNTHGNGFHTRERTKALTRSFAQGSGVINSSLYASGRKAGMSNALLAEMIRAYSWDVDFQRDIRKGDRFEVMYERFLDEDGGLAYNGKILFATLTLRGNRNAIYRHETLDGEIDYYNEKAQSARKALLRTPIDGARLSSRFGKRRHPILGYTKMHRGADFAAARGTPIYAAGNGSIDYAGRKGAYGKYIRIRHNTEYSTAYAHMHRLAKGMYKGRRVKQGQVIGYVGTTGRSTGPHLHYEILRKGRRANPLKVKMPSGRKLKGSELANFKSHRQDIDVQYATSKTTTVAKNP